MIKKNRLRCIRIDGGGGYGDDVADGVWLIFWVLSA